MANFFSEPLRRGCRLFAVCLLLLAAPRAGSGEGLEDGHAHFMLALAHAERDEWEQAAREATAAASLLRMSGKQGLPEALEVLGTAELMLGRPAHAAEHFREGLTACGSCEERLGLLHLLSSAYLEIALAHFERDEWEPAAREAAEAVALLRGSGKQKLPEALVVLGNSELMLGHLAQAADHFREGLTICGSCEVRLQLRLLLSAAYLKIALAHFERDEWEPAAREATEAVALLRDSGKQNLPEALVVLGTAEFKLGHLAQAADHFREGLTACGSCEKRLQLQHLLSSAYLKIALAHSERDEWEPAAREAAEAAALLRDSGKQNLPEALVVLGNSELMLGLPAQAADHFREGLTVCGSCKERHQLRYLLSSAYTNLGRYSEAESLLRELLAEAEAAGSTEIQASSLKGLAGVAVVQGHRAEALSLLQEALRKEDAAGKPAADRVDVLERIGVLLGEAGDGKQALEFLRQTEALLAGRSEPSRLRRLHFNMAEAHVALGNYDTALTLFEEVETASRQSGDTSTLAQSLSGSAEILQMRGRLEGAQKRFEEALELEKRNGRRGGEAKALVRLAQIDLALGLYSRAFSRFEEAAAVSRAAADRQSVLTSLAASADMYMRLKRAEEAIALAHQFGELVGENASHDRLLEALITSMQLFAANRLNESLQKTDEALALVRQMGARPLEEWILESRAALLFLMDRMDEALHDAKAALALSREFGEREEEARLNWLIGFILLLEKSYDEARISLEQSLRIEREIFGPRAITLWALGATYERQRNSTAAIAAYRESVEVSESAFPEVWADDLLAGLAEKAIGSYESWARLLVQKGDVEQAFAVSERARARAFLRRMGNPPPDLRNTVDPALLREEESLREKIQTLTKQLREKQSKTAAEQDRLALANIAREIDGARRDYETLRIRIQQANPEYASLVHPSPITVPEVQKLLDGETTLIEYLLLEDQSLAWVIERDAVHLVRLTMHGDEVAERVEELRHRIAARQPVQGDALILYLNLFAQLEPYIHHTNLIVVPHGALHALPFGALTPDAGKTWLVERYALSVLPSASVLSFLLGKRPREGSGMLALGDPDGSLPAAAAEARAVAALYGSQAFVGREASAAALRGAPRPIGHLHIAAHAAFDPARPLFSRIRLADGDLAAHDIFGLDLRGTQLVVLSGCETGVGPATDVGELESLSRAFLYAGAPAVMATLWRVDDLASRALMEAFYRRLRAGTPTAEALRQAQLEILRGGEWRHPFFWAGFTLTGVSGR